MAVRPQIRPNTYSKNQASTEAEQRARNTAMQMADNNNPSDREREREQASAAAKEISQLEAVASGDYSGLTRASNSGSKNRQIIREAQRVAALYNADPESFSGNYRERQEQIRAQQRLQDRVEKYGYGATEQETTTDGTNTGIDLITDGILGDTFDKPEDTTINTTTDTSADTSTDTGATNLPVSTNTIDVPTMHVEFERNADGNIVKGADGKNVVKSFGVKYADGTISYTGTGREGVLEASRQRSQALEYNKYIDDNRTREDFDSEEEYNNFNIVKNIRIGQGTYRMIGGLDGQSVLQGPGGIEIAKGNFASIKQSYRTESNKLNLALAASQRTPRVTEYGLRYMVENNPNISNREEAYQAIYTSYVNNRKQLSDIVSGWTQKAQEQNLMVDGNVPWSLPFIPSGAEASLVDFDTFKTNFTFADDPKFPTYEDWYKANVTGIESVVKEEKTEVEPGVEQTIETPNASTPTSTPSAQSSIVTGGGQPVGSAATTTTGDFYQPFEQTPKAIPTTTTPFQTVDGVYPTTGSGTTGTISTPLTGTSTLSAIPATTTVYGNYTGTTMPNLTTQSQQGYGGQVQYRNPQTGQIIMVSIDAAGNPLTYVPPGYEKVVTTMSEGGDVQLARKFLGFDGPVSQLENFLNSSPALAARMGKYRQAMASMSPMRMGANEGTDVSVNPAVGSTVYGEDTGTTLEQFQKMQQNLITQTMQPTQAPVTQITPESADFIGSTAGQAVDLAPVKEAAKVADVTQVGLPKVSPVATMSPATVTPGIQTVTDAIAPITGTLGTQAQVDAAQQVGTSVSGVEVAQGTAIKVDGPEARKIKTDPVTGESEIISGVANAETAKNFTEAIQAEEATPSKKATVTGQLEQLMTQFEGGNTPAWAAGAMRTAMATLSARGLGASSLAGQAVIQAAMESAIPIAQIDAQTQAQFEAQNLSNRQQKAMLAAQQRATFLGMEFDQAFQARVQNASKLADIANMNFTAEQQIALEDSRAANTVNLNNLSNRQAKVLAEAAALANLDMANLSNRQQAAVQNAQSFLQMDMTNLSNEQQTEIFKTQQNIQALFTDQAAENAAAQFNATSENQTNQFFANLSTQVGQFNSAQENAMNQFNVNAVNALRQFNGEIQQQRDLFNAQNGLVIAQANAQWRQNIATLNTAAQNESNMDIAKTLNAMSMKNLDEIWQRERDIMSFAFSSDEAAMDRALQIILGDKELEAARLQLDEAKSASNTKLAARFLFGTSPEGILGFLN